MTRQPGPRTKKANGGKRPLQSGDKGAAAQPAPKTAQRRKLTRPRDAMTGRLLKTCEIVALEIVRDIVAQRLHPGDGLPSETQMLKRYRTSRFSLREALRLLEVQGLITIRRGRGTSTAVGESHPSNLARTLNLHLHLKGATYKQLLDAWVQTEPLLARLAAENLDRERVERLLRPYTLNSGAADEYSETIDQGLRFHEIVADLAGNPVLSLSLSAITAIQTQHILSVTHRHSLEDVLVHDHQHLARAIIAGHGKKAESLMREHDEHIVKEFTAYWPQQVGERIEWH